MNNKEIKNHYTLNEIIIGLTQNMSLLGLCIENIKAELKEVRKRSYENFSEIHEIAVNSQRKFDVIFDELKKMKDSKNA